MLARVREKAATVAEKALVEIERRIDDRVDIDHGDHGWKSCPIEVKDLIAAAKLATAVKIELGGDPHGTPVAITGKLEALSLKDLRKLAGEA